MPSGLVDAMLSDLLLLTRIKYLQYDFYDLRLGQVVLACMKSHSRCVKLSQQGLNADSKTTDHLHFLSRFEENNRYRAWCKQLTVMDHQLVWESSCLPQTSHSPPVREFELMFAEFPKPKSHQPLLSQFEPTVIKINQLYPSLPVE
ncbi:hypothetical protein J6590_005626 [Homalodisca vitripennis]|nr:hypothetical protein J6590_005626 [Homalodisca vitripennis]